MGLPDGVKTLRINYNRLHTIPACDGQTDGIVRAMIMNTGRAVKTIQTTEWLNDIKEAIDFTKSTSNTE